MNEAQKLKTKKTKEANERKLFDFMGYEIKKDQMQFIAKFGNRNWYYSTLTALFRDLRIVHSDHVTDTGVKLSEIVEKLEKRDKEFLAELTKALKTLPESLR